MKDIAMLDQMYELNLKYYKELTMYIIAVSYTHLDVYKRQAQKRLAGKRHLLCHGKLYVQL